MEKNKPHSWPAHRAGWWHLVTQVPATPSPACLGASLAPVWPPSPRHTWLLGTRWRRRAGNFGKHHELPTTGQWQLSSVQHSAGVVSVRSTAEPQKPLSPHPTALPVDGIMHDEHFVFIPGPFFFLQ